MAAVCLLFLLYLLAIQGGLTSPSLTPNYNQADAIQGANSHNMESPGSSMHAALDQNEERGRSPFVSQRPKTSNAFTEAAGVTAAQLAEFKRYAQWAGASYCGPVATTPVFCRGDICPAGEDVNATIYDVFYGTTIDVLAFLAISPTTSEIIVSVRGTCSLTNWLNDTLWAQQPTDLCDACSAHVGLYAAYSEIVGPINTSLRSALARHPGYQITMTGHSLGGGVATLLAAHFRDALRGVLLAAHNSGGIALYTYGSPRVGNLALAAYVTQQQSGRPSGGNFRITHAADVVPRVPPAVHGFRHVSPEYWLAAGPSTRTAYVPEDVDRCDGYANGRCNAGAAWWAVDVRSHWYYLVAIGDCGKGATPRMPSSDHCGNGTTWPWGPVNGTTATNGSVDGLSPETANRLAMFAKLDQEFMAALEEGGGESVP